MRDERQIVCKFCKLIKKTDSGYMIALYKSSKKGAKPKKYGGTGLDCFTAVGMNLPMSNVSYRLTGYDETYKGRTSFHVTSYEVVADDKKSLIIATLQTYDGMSKNIAERAYAAFGDDALTIADTDIDRYATLPRYKAARFEMFKRDYILHKGYRKLLNELTPFGVNKYQIERLVKYCQGETFALRDLERDPYILCKVAKVQFPIADDYARHKGVGETDPRRIAACAIRVMRSEEAKGNTCVEWNRMCSEIQKKAQLGDLSFEKAKEVIYPPVTELVKNGTIVQYKPNGRGPGTFALKDTDGFETKLARRIAYMVNSKPNKIISNADTLIERIQGEMGITLADKQVEAVKLALGDNRVCVITGGPGTGKSTILKVILEGFSKQHPEGKILCVSPTGKAARRMTECTGYAASTIHSALGLFAGTEDMDPLVERVRADLIVCDETSMVDTYVACCLLDALERGSRCVFVGDSDQLPSVGAGRVLADLIESGTVPFVKLDKVYRQKAGSYIATNALKINHGETDLQTGEDFEHVPCTEKNAVEVVLKEYERACEEVGQENVILLSPRRQSGPNGEVLTSVNNLNKLIQDRRNPESPDNTPAHEEGERYPTSRFRKGDPVMQTRNRNGIANGEVGVITAISKDGLRVTFEDCAEEYFGEDLNYLDLAYATTIHKSQGGEWPVVLMVLLNQHAGMLTRPLIYTGVTRGKKRVTIVGERSAVEKAIKTTDTDVRMTNLRHKIVQYN